jgi:hypothetical protein
MFIDVGARFLMWTGANPIAPHPYCLESASLRYQSEGRVQRSLPLHVLIPVRPTRDFASPSANGSIAIRLRRK